MMEPRRGGGGATFAERLVEESPDALIALSLDGRVLSWNRGAETILGYTAAEAIGSMLIELVVPAAQRADARLQLFEAQQRLAGSGSSGSTSFCALRRHKDGSPIFLDISMRRVDATGGEPFIAVSKKDVTQLRRLRDQRAVEERFRGLLEAAPDAMVIVGKNGNIQLVNGQVEALFGYKREELLGQPVEMLVPDFGDPRARPMGAGLSLEGVRRDGTEFPVEISLAPMQTDAGVLVTAAIRDVTDRKRAETKFRNLMVEANRLKSEFLANMSHELRTPLNAIIGFAELMHKGKVGPVSPDHREYLGDILTSSKHLLQLINDVLDLSKVESGKMEFRPEPVEIAKIVGEVRDILRGLAASKHLRVEASVDPDLGLITADPARLKQMLYNYLSNAIKFTPQGGSITVRVTTAGPDLFRLDVEDSGIGMSAENLGKLFVEFQQLDASAAKKYQGTGLGLALTKRIIEAQGGRVEVQSVLGEGSTFSAILPRVATVVSEARTSVRPGPMLDTTILVVDDDPTALRLVEATVDTLGYQLFSRSNAESALELALDDPPGIIVLDLLMPRIDGFEFISRFRELPGCAHVPIIIWTVRDLTPHEKARLQTTASAFVSKRKGDADALMTELRRFSSPAAQGALHAR